MINIIKNIRLNYKRTGPNLTSEEGEAPAPSSSLHLAGTEHAALAPFSALLPAYTEDTVMTYAPIRLQQPFGETSSWAPRLAKRILRAIGHAWTVWANRRSIARLAMLDDRYLGDIGLTRSDINWALMQRWPVDTSVELANRVARRRDARNWALCFYRRP